MLRLAICDDDGTLTGDLKREVEAWAENRGMACSVQLFGTADAFLFTWEEEKDIDVLLLDIEMPGMDGMALARKLRCLGERMEIIFVTGNPDFALEGYELEAASYIVKPVKRERLRAALDRAVKRVRCRTAVLVPLSAGEVERVYVSDICFLESGGHDTLLRKRDGTCLTCRMGLQQLEQQLGEASDAFFKPHRSFFINLDYVERITKKDVWMEGGTLVPIARGKWEPLNEAYMKYYRRQCREKFC